MRVGHHNAGELVMAKKPDRPKALVDAALELAAVQGWRDTTLTDIAQQAKVSLAELYGHFPSKTAVLAAFLRRLDSAMLAGGDGDQAEESARERLFDVIMRRFDALAPHREAVRSILRDTGRDPVAMLCAATGPSRRSLAWMLEAAGLDSDGLRGRARINGLGLIYFSVLRVWLDDDSEDMARTMAALDKRLKRVESLITSLPGRRRHAGDAGDAEAAA